MSTSVIKSSFKTALAEAVYNEILYNTNPYYYFLGKPGRWGDIDTPHPVDDNLTAEIDARNNIVFIKKISPTDVSFTVPRYDWTSGTVYDMYDDQLQISVNVSAQNDSITLEGVFNRNTFGPGWVVSGTGIDTDTTVVSVTNTTVTISKATTAKIDTSVTFVKPTASAPSLDKCKFFVLTANNNVYKCLDNNNSGLSTIQPSSFSIQPFSTSDGYVWKYMYTVPSAFVNRFLSSTDVPVTTAVKQSYYSGGAISSVTMLSYGTEYLPGDAIIVNGDGHLTGNKYRLLTASVVNPGAGYTTTTPTATIDYPLGLNNVNIKIYGQGESYEVGDYIEHENRVYAVVSTTNVVGTSGVIGNDIPVHTISTPVLNGEVSLQYVGTRAECTISGLDGDKIDGVVLSNGFIGQIRVIDAGSGYNLPDTEPPIEDIPSQIGVGILLDGGNTSATATARNSITGYISKITVTNPGSGYSNNDTLTVTIDEPVSIVETATQAAAQAVVYYGYGYDVVPTVNVSPPFLEEQTLLLLKYPGIQSDVYACIQHPVQWDLGISYEPGDVVRHTDNIVYYCNTLHTSTALLAPTSTNSYWNAVGSVNNNGTYSWDSTVWDKDEDEDFIYVTQSVTAGKYISFENRFYKALSSNIISASQPPIHASGSVLNGNVQLEYKGETAVIKIVAQQTKAEILPIVEEGQIVGTIITEGGEGYTSANITVSSNNGTGAQLIPDLSYGDLNTRQSSVELLAERGTINSIDILDGGSGYNILGGVNSAVVIDGDGTGCTAETVVVNSVIKKIRITNPGSGYTYANVTINGDKVDQAYCRAIISPVKGHGSNAIKELFATDLSFSTTVSKDLNQGFDIENQYRQIGIIKNINVFDYNLRYAGFTGSACFVIGGDFSYSTIDDDQIITDEDGNRYRVVAATVTAALVQSIDNSVPRIDDVVNYADGRPQSPLYNVTLTSVTEPTIDKYSGEILFIDNRAAFKPEDDQTVSIKTSIRL